MIFPEDSADTFLVMADNESISKDESENMADIARFRNRRVHQYWRIDDYVIWDILIKDRDDIIRYNETILSAINT